MRPFPTAWCRPICLALAIALSGCGATHRLCLRREGPAAAPARRPEMPRGDKPNASCDEPFFRIEANIGME
jgi:hypothetical protein